MSFTIGDGIVDYDDGNDFVINFNQSNVELTNKNIKKEVKDFINDSKNIIGNDFINESKIELFDNNFNNDNSIKSIENILNESVVNESVPKSNEKVLFSVFQTESQEIDGRAKILFNQKEYDTHNYFCNNTSKFHPKVSGFYQINCGVNCFSQNGKTLLIELLKNGKVFKRGEQTNLLNEIITYKTTFLSSLIYLNGEDDYIEINVICSPKFLTYPGEEFTWMNGFLIN